MSSHITLIGNHPASSNKFGEWLLCDDKPITPTKIHRSLKGSISTVDVNLIDWLARKLIKHHHSDFRLDLLKQNYKKLGFDKYAAQHRKLPTSDKTKKGNCTEIILTEYIESCLGKNLIKVYKLQFNPNVDQAIKGDDTLLLDMTFKNGASKVRIYLGEAKFRAVPTKTVIDEIAESLSQDKKPLSLTFIADEIAKTDTVLATHIDDLILDEIKKKGDLIYAGLLLSDDTTCDVVEKHLNSDNPDFVMISMGINSPADLIKEAFLKAEYYVQNPHLI